VTVLSKLKETYHKAYVEEGSSLQQRPQLPYSHCSEFRHPELVISLAGCVQKM